MSATYPPYKSFTLDDEDQQPTNSYNNPYSNNYPDGGNQFENTNSTLNQAGLKTEKSRVSFNQAGLNPEKTRSSLNQTGSIHEHTNSTLIRTSQTGPDSNNEVNPGWTDDPPHSHHHVHHTHTHHQHDSDDHQHHHHHQPQHEHIHHQHHEHIHHQHEQPQHDHEHTHHHHHDHDHSHHNHIHDHHSQTLPLPPIHHHGNTASALTIRRHVPGSADPILHSFPSSYTPNHIYTSPMQEIPPPPNVHVTIKRNTPQVDHTLIQPILYPVAVFTNSSAPQLIKETPKPRSPKPRRLPPKSPPPKPPTPKPRTPLRTSPIPPVSPAKPSPVPPKPPVKKPVKPPPPPPSPPPKSPVRPEPSPVPPPKTKNVLVRKPIRTDVVTSTVRRVIQAPSAPPRPTTRVVVQQPPNYNQYRRPAVYPGSKKLVSYRTVPGMTTREMENDEMDDSGAPIFVQTPRVQTVTYRT